MLEPQKSVFTKVAVMPCTKRNASGIGTKMKWMSALREFRTVHTNLCYQRLRWRHWRFCFVYFSFLLFVLTLSDFSFYSLLGISETHRHFLSDAWLMSTLAPTIVPVTFDCVVFLVSEQRATESNIRSKSDKFECRISLSVCLGPRGSPRRIS